MLCQAIMNPLETNKQIENINNEIKIRKKEQN